MSFDFTPMTEEEIDKASFLQDGVYDFEVQKSKRDTSKKGNPMSVLDLRIFDREGQAHFLRDWLTFSSVPLCIRKIKHFCDTTGLQDKYNTGSLPEEFDFLCGKVLVGIKEAEPKEDGGFHPKKNVVVDYIGSKPQTAQQVKVEINEVEADLFNDALPF